MNNYEKIATGRSSSCFDALMKKHEQVLKNELNGSRVLVIGAAGSIGASVVKNIIPYSCSSLTLVDLSENNLVELTRLLRSELDTKLPENTEILPLDFGSIEFLKYFKENGPYDYILNLSAMKHVRSEKNIYTISRMFKTNVVHLDSLLATIDYKPKKVFSVSSDKAVNPTNLMGASKRSMELVLESYSNKFPVSCARFANVAFSDGSLPYGFLERIKLYQCLSAPNDVKRFFISHEEAGQLCVLAAVLGENNDIFYPNLEEELNEKKFDDIAVELVQSMGYEVKLCKSEEEAKKAAENILITKEWPCYFSKSGTSGEKMYEEFFSNKEKRDEERFKLIGVVKHSENTISSKKYKSYINYLDNFIFIDGITKSDVIKEVNKVIPTLKHIETGKNLDGKM